MSTTDSQVFPAPPNLIRALLGGFDTIANHIGLILFSIVLDLLLWFGLQVRLVQMARSYLDWTLQSAQQQTPQLMETMRASRDALLTIAERFNLLSALRSFPLGVPSLMAGRGPIESPFGKPVSWEMSSAGGLAIIWISLLLLGLFVGALYFSLIAQAVMQGKFYWKDAIREWPGRFIQVVLLSIFYLVLLLAVCLPLSCVVPFLMMGGASLGRVVIFLYGAMLIWLLFPLVFSPFGIFIYQDKMWASVLRGARIVRYTMPTTILFVLVMVVLSQGLDMLWNIPVDSSWFVLVGILGHAFVAAGLLAAAFIYYRDAGLYVSQRLQRLKV
jgi:hypothetical protein